MIVIMKYTIYQHSFIIAGEPIHIASKQLHHAPHLRIYRLMLRYQLCSTRYAAVRIRTFVIKVATMKITDDLMEAITCLPLNLIQHFSW